MCTSTTFSNNYPWRELFTLLRDSGYDRYTLCEMDPAESESRSVSCVTTGRYGLS